jgi:excisionase family DNA binding protein
VQSTHEPIVPEAWSVQQVADRLHVSEDTVRRLIAASAFPGAFRLGRKLIRIPVTDLQAYQHRARLLAQIAHAEAALDVELSRPIGDRDERPERRDVRRRPFATRSA